MIWTALELARYRWVRCWFDAGFRHVHCIVPVGVAFGLFKMLVTRRLRVVVAGWSRWEVCSRGEKSTWGGVPIRLTIGWTRGLIPWLLSVLEGVSVADIGVWDDTVLGLSCDEIVEPFGSLAWFRLGRHVSFFYRYTQCTTNSEGG